MSVFTLIISFLLMLGLIASSLLAFSSSQKFVINNCADFKIKLSTIYLSTFTFTYEFKVHLTNFSASSLKTVLYFPSSTNLLWFLTFLFFPSSPPFLKDILISLFLTLKTTFHLYKGLKQILSSKKQASLKEIGNLWLNNL